MTGLLKNILKPPFKHKKLSDDFASLEQTICEDGVSFACRQLGSTFVTEAQDDAMTADAIRRIVHAARVSNLKPRRVTLHVSSRGIRVQCASSAEIILDTDIYNITYCSADALYNHVFAFITTAERDAYECHAYLCHSAKAARMVNLSIAQAFKVLARKYLDDHPEMKTDNLLREKCIGKMSFKDIIGPSDQEESSEEDRTNGISSSAHFVDMECDTFGVAYPASGSVAEDKKSGSQNSTSVLCLGDLPGSKSSNNVHNSLRKNWLILKSGLRGANPQMSRRLSVFMLSDSEHKVSPDEDTVELLFLEQLEDAERKGARDNA